MRVRIRLTFVLNVRGTLPKMGSILDAAEGALRGLYPTAVTEEVDADIEPGTHLQVTTLRRGKLVGRGKA
jgi:hypothetical protein